MADAPAPILVYNRIDANRLNTHLLFGCLAALGLPLAWGASQFLAPLIALGTGTLDREHPFQSGIPAQIVAFGMVALGAAVVSSIVYLGSLVSSFLLWHAGARAIGHDDEPQLRRTVENLCIGAGLQPPRLYVIESPAPNAFAVGYDPQHARLVVTRGLLDLLDRRELSGVLAHELSHIGNRDTELFTALAAFVTVVRLPQFVMMGLASLFPLFGPAGTILGLVVFWAVALYILLVTALSSIQILWGVRAGLPMELTTGQAIAMLVPAYAFVVAPFMAVFVRKMISYQREFLADADAALLTRDPEGLALALAKASAAIDAPMRGTAAIAHMFFIDTAPPGRWSWLGGRSYSHPPVDNRIALLTRMGDGVVEGLSAAADAGVNYRGTTLLRQYGPPDLQAAAAAGATNDYATHYTSGTHIRLIDDRTALYRSPDHLSGIEADLDSGVEVTILGREAGFYHVRAMNDQAGYIDVTAGTRRCEPSPGDDSRTGYGIHYRPVPGPAFTPQCLPGTKFRLTDHLTPLYAKPDGWSGVVEQLSAGQIVTYSRLEGNFARVLVERLEGYIPRTAGAEALTAQLQHG